jgi:superfamily II DNA/RNA helicase
VHAFVKKLVLLGSIVFLRSSAAACCAVGPDTVSFGDQLNTIIWNPETQMEHFIRVANFESNAADFAFIAPSPDVPELALADPELFSLLSALKPKTLEEWFTQKGWKIFSFQKAAWQAYLDGKSGLIHVATGSGKTLAYLLPIIQRLYNDVSSLSSSTNYSKSATNKPK